MFPDIFKITRITQGLGPHHVHRDQEPMPVRQFPRPLGQKLILSGIECILAAGEYMIDLEP